MELYNTLTRSKQEFKPIDDKKVGIYSCGPTVYWNQHIGHMYAYVQWDSLVRALKYLGYQVKWVMNITDVGHLTSDEDEGEDKMEKGAKREGISVWEIADKYIKQFKDSMALLNIQLPDVIARATDHIQEQIDLIKKIEERGFTYQTKTGLVFDTAKFPDYAKFANLKLDKQEAGARVEVDTEKRNPWDFLLWVTNQPEHIMKWESPWGVGFPGWHIECTAMSTKYLGESFDIHTGGKEHVAVHHTNEIAQSYGAFGHQTANYWLHNEWLLINGEKMSKSLGNNVTAEDLKAKGYDLMALRYLILTSHYRKGIDFTFESLDGASKALNRLRTVAANLVKEVKEGGEAGLEEMVDYGAQFREALEDDLNMPEALATVWKTIKSGLGGQEKLALLATFDQVLGLDIFKVGHEEVTVSDEARKLVDLRDSLRMEKKWEEADKVRQQLEEMGFKVLDTKNGTSLG